MSKSSDNKDKKNKGNVKKADFRHLKISELPKVKPKQSTHKMPKDKKPPKSTYPPD